MEGCSINLFLTSKTIATKIFPLYCCRLEIVGPPSQNLIYVFNGDYVGEFGGILLFSFSVFAHFYTLRSVTRIHTSACTSRFA